MSIKPWDARLAGVIVRPLVHTPITPNHVTTLRLVVGLVAVGVLAHGGRDWTIAGAVLFVLSNFIDHWDGQLAQLTGKSSHAGDVYDRWCDAIVQILVFAGIGVGLRLGPMGLWGPIVGIFGAISVGTTYLLNALAERDQGPAASDQPSWAGFEIEDILYLTPVLAAAGGLGLLPIAACVGGPIYSLWTVWRWRSLRRAGAKAETIAGGTPTPLGPAGGTPAPLGPAGGTPAPLGSAGGTPAPLGPAGGTPAPLGPAGGTPTPLGPVAIILAAGVGRRLGEGTGAKPGPKCLLGFSGRTLLDRHLGALGDLGIRETVIVTGHDADAIESAIRGQDEAPTLVHNPDYRRGSVVSLWSARQWLERGTEKSGWGVLVMDADVLYDPLILRRLIESPHENCCLIDRGFEEGDEPVKVWIRDGRIVELGKGPAPDQRFDTVGESVGFFRLSAAMAVHVARACQRRVEAGDRDEPHENALREVILANSDRFAVEDITGLPWTEIDVPGDIQRARDDVLPRIERGCGCHVRTHVGATSSRAAQMSAPDDGEPVPCHVPPVSPS